MKSLPPALAALALLAGCCPCLEPPDARYVPRPPTAGPAPDPEPDPTPADDECEWFYDVAYDGCTDMPDPPVEPCVHEEGAICDGRLDGARPIQVVRGGGYVCALFDSGRVKCLGGNSYGVLGLGHDQPRGRVPEEAGDALRYVDLGDDAHVVELSAGASHTCALMGDGRVKCWGSNLDGQLGLGDDRHRGDHRGEMGDRLPYVDLGHQRAVHIAAADRHTCALMSDGAVKCWGYDGYGALGAGTWHVDRGHRPETMGAALVAVDLGSDCAPVLSLHAGHDMTCALFADRRAKCWGINGFGQLGHGHDGAATVRPEDMGDALPYIDLGDDDRIRDLAVGGRFACALLEAGGVKCWGEGLHGQVGLPDMASNVGLGADGRMGEALPYVDLGRPDDPVQIVATDDAACALFADGWVKCWGNGLGGQLGLGDRQHRGDDPGEMGEALPYVPLDRPTDLLVAANHGGFCAWLDDGGIVCWGFGWGEVDTNGRATDRGDEPGEMSEVMPPLDFGR